MALLVALALAAIAHRRTRRHTQLDDDGDLSRLLQGALQRPAAFEHLPALFQRRLIPLADGRALSLDRARTLAAKGRLFRSRAKTGLAEQALRRGVEILDDTRAEASTVADTLGATDLDRWSSLLERGRSLPVLDRLNAYLRDVGERWEVMAIESPGIGVSSLDLHALRTRDPRHRVILIDARDPWLLEAEDRLGQRPATALLLLLDHLLERLGLEPERRARLLAPQARAAVQEGRP
jgi:hypothetical protein